MGRIFCPKCGNFNFGYDQRAKVHRCYSVKCDFVIEVPKNGEGLSENPFSAQEAFKLEYTVNREMDESERHI
ncbi:hypothetical protein MUO65_02520 [bacterium]|nr:hypothetical protein [bacterium]